MALLARQLAGAVVGPFDLELEAGRCTVVTGPSGVGKSLLLRMLADLDPCRGEVSLDGCSRSSMSGPAWRRQVTYVAAEPGWWADRVRAHFDDLEAVRSLLPDFGLADKLLDQPVSQLSTGERQRMAMVRALVRQPRFLLLDEPTSALDADTTLQVEAAFQRLKQQGMGLLVVTHNEAQAQRLHDRRLRMTRQGLAEEARA
ncbi:ABC transporter ATP-binding protein [Variovorax terrae]|uniref:ABC transporter ATP-binding protein n=1 Tax=Variovorax terrae TaxID=2923278 RepID=A0A9X1VRJ4_9BURK|nr:ABC transporter ATP-binding protein [Variovorax terrae]MCJ0761625.1 ABC transporter ATP-binding protein [Variovorax terrae]